MLIAAHALASNHTVVTDTPSPSPVLLSFDALLVEHVCELLDRVAVPSSNLGPIASLGCKNIVPGFAFDVGAGQHQQSR